MSLTPAAGATKHHIGWTLSTSRTFPFHRVAERPCTCWVLPSEAVEVSPRGSATKSLAKHALDVVRRDRVFRFVSVFELPSRKYRKQRCDIPRNVLDEISNHGFQGLFPCAIKRVMGPLLTSWQYSSQSELYR
jgi:hypothetical protein